MFALEVAMGQPTARMTASAHSSSGMRRAIVPPVPTNAGGTAAEARTMRVSAPGQNACASADAYDGTSRPYRIRSSIDPTSHGIALPASRRLMP